MVSTTEQPRMADNLVRAAELIITAQYGSAQMLERKLRIARDEAAQLLDELQLLHVVGPATDTGTRPLLVTSDELDQALREVREHAARHRLVVDTEQVDTAHGGEVVLRGGLGMAELHPDDPERPHLVATPIPDTAGGGVATSPPAVPPAAQSVRVGQVATLVVLAAARVVWTTGQGVTSWWLRSYSAATFGMYREQVRLARAAGDREKLRESLADLDEAKKRRQERKLRRYGEALTVLQVVVLAATLLGVGGVALGVGFWLTDGGWGWSDWWGAVGAALVVFGSVIWWVAYWSPWVAAPAVLYAAYREGQRGGTPLWLLKPEQRLLEGKQVTPAKVVLAMRDLGIAELRKSIEAAPDGGGWMISNIVPAGCGVEVDVALPSGVSTDQIQARRRKLAENLDRHEHELFITIPPMPRHVRLWIADPGALDEPIGPSPLVTDPALKADLQNGRAPFGVDLRGDPVGVSLYQRHTTITGLSNQGKTKTLRSLALWAARDPSVDFDIGDLKGDDDWLMFDDPNLTLTYIQGPTDDHVARVTEMLEAAVEEMNRRLLAPKGTKWRKRIVIVDEAQVAFMCPEVDEQRRPYGGTKRQSRFFRAVRQLENQGRAVDVTLWLGTQDPTDQNFPKLIRENVHIRISLVVGTESQSRMALGDKAVDQGASPHLLRVDLDKGTVVMHGGVQLEPGQASVTVRSHFIDDDEAAEAARQAVALRKGRRQRPAIAAPSVPDHLRAIHAAMRGENRVRTAVLLGRLIEDDADLYEPWSHQDLKRALAGPGGDESPAVEIRKSGGNSVVFLEDVEEALTSRDDNG